MTRLVVAKRELASLRAEKTIVLAIAIQLFVAAFSGFLVVGLVSLYEPGATGGGYTVDVGVAGNATDDLAPVVDAASERRVSTFETETAARDAFERGRVDALMLATERPNGRVAVQAIAPEGSFRTTLIVTQLKDALQEFERQRRAELDGRLHRQPLDVPDEVPANPYFGFAYTVLVPLLMVLPAFISGSIAADSLAEERERGTLELLRVAPLSLPEIVDGKALAFAGIAPVQAAVWLGLLALNGIQVAHPLALLCFVAAAATVLVGAGEALALRVPDRRDAQLLYSFGALAAIGAASLLPESPANVAAKLAIGSPTLVTWLTLAGLVAVAAAVYAGFRRATSDYGP
ncbi:ABC transporter permease [Halocalculus aciditolerans]|uniref:ABC-2 type transporter transmembrane domain-containing protein n=1 Tax=Halocalculus aciditolerans TaxID=1383812 RepID=A0A830FC41_9EURY|nr:ABC transporter permease [Halocalculus aciditolerans]GGL60529.1 hypothetical protein GCM10009039_18510 [Halocalculus aciditolerans]